jgi:hypothetical protein
MTFTEPSTARQEAEKLVAALLAAATIAANANPHWSTGSTECCVCPLCKVIAAVRDPDPEMVERVATGAGDLAAGVASFLRHVASPAAKGSGESSEPWQAATADQPPAPEKKVVKKAVKATVKKAPKQPAHKKAG